MDPSYDRLHVDCSHPTTVPNSTLALTSKQYTVMNVRLVHLCELHAASQHLSPRRPGVRSQVKSMWDLWWTKWHWDRFFSELSVFPCQFHSNGVPLIVKIGKKLIILIIFIGVAQKALRLWCEGPSSKNKKKLPLYTNWCWETGYYRSNIPAILHKAKIDILICLKTAYHMNSRYTAQRMELFNIYRLQLKHFSAWSIFNGLQGKSFWVCTVNSFVHVSIWFACR
jgi:hypothetical protein